MARYYYSGARDTVEGAHRVELSWLRGKGYFPSEGGNVSGSIHWSRNGEDTGSIGISVDTHSSFPEIRFNYRTLSHSDSNGEWKPMNYAFTLEKLPCRYGGYKWFVRCGLSRGGVYCGRRVRILYGTSGYYGCRHCANLSYESCNEGKRFKSGAFGFLSQQWKADDLLDTIPRTHYRGKPTRKYRKYLKMVSHYDPREVDRALEEINQMLGGKTKKKS